MRLKFIYIALFLSFITTEIYGQDPVYSQYYTSPILVNPAFAGNTRGALVAINYRNQWPSIDNAYETYSLTYDQRWNKSSGVGLYLNTDAAGNGALKTTKLGGIYSYRIRVQDELYVKGAIDVAFGQSRLDQSKLVFLDNLDPQFGLMTPGGISFPTQEVLAPSPTRSYLDISTGVLLYNPNYYLGISFKHLNSPNIDFINDQTGDLGTVPLRWTVNAGAQFSLDGRNNDEYGTFISPNILFVKQQDFWQINVGAYLNVLQVFGGAWYRHSGINGDAVIASLGVKTGMFKISYSFDYTVSGLTVGSGGSHEIGIGINFDKLLPKESKYNDCLMLFR